MNKILHTRIPYDAMAPKSLPGISPLMMDDWIIIDETYAAQMAERRRLITRSAGAVMQLDESARVAANELLDLALAEITRRKLPGFMDEETSVICPDGIQVEIDRAAPLATLGQILQEDHCVLQKCNDEHVLTGAVLCFPASWTLEQKFMKPLVGIHTTVDSYDANIARRVQRLFDGVRVDRPMWRFNALWYGDPRLHQPRLESETRPEVGPNGERFFRSERQAILRLPKSNAVIFSIHTFVLAEDDMAT